MNRCAVVLIFIVLAFLVGPLSAADRLELQAGPGYARGGGSEDPGPSLATVNLGAAFWFTDRWGIAVRHVEGPGEDLYDPPIVSPDRTFLGPADLSNGTVIERIFLGHANLSYNTVTARYRRSLPRLLELNLGFGLMFGGRFDTVMDILTPSGQWVRGEAQTSFLGLSVELLVGKKLTRHFGIKAGVTQDFNFETNNLQPVVMGVFSF